VLGKCTNCGDWDSLIELNAERSTSSTIKATPITEIEKEDITVLALEVKIGSGIGGWIVDGSLVLIGGSPGIGKSTLLLRVLEA